MGEKQPCRHQGQYRRRTGAAPGTEAEVPLQPTEQTTARQAVPAAMETHGGADPRSQPRKDPTAEQRDMTRWGARAGAGPPQEPRGAEPAPQQVCRQGW